jgi:putative ABC transport system ATP-binding protein
MVFQRFNLVPHLTAVGNVMIGLTEVRGVSEADARTTARIMLDRVGLGARATFYPSELSGGQQQRVAGARALVSRPEIVYADEPTGNLDSKSGVELLSFLRSAVDDHHQTIVMVTHDPSAASFADRVVFLSDGHVVDEMRDPTSERVLDRLKLLEV